MKKICSCCKKELSEENFSKSKNSKDGLQGYCKKCDAEYRRKRKLIRDRSIKELKKKLFNT